MILHAVICRQAAVEVSRDGWNSRGLNMIGEKHSDFKALSIYDTHRHSENSSHNRRGTNVAFIKPEPLMRPPMLSS
jgi:hypothetical protein